MDTLSSYLNSQAGVVGIIVIMATAYLSLYFNYRLAATKTAILDAIDERFLPKAVYASDKEAIDDKFKELRARIVRLEGGNRE